MGIGNNKAPSILFLVLIILFVVTLVSGVFGWPTLLPGVNKEAEIILSLVLALTLPSYLMNLNYDRKYSNVIVETEARLRSIDDEMKTIGRLKYIGDVNDAAKDVAEKIKKCNRIINTFIVAEDPYTDETKEQLIATIIDVTSKPNTKWDDILSPLGAHRVEAVKDKDGKLPHRMTQGLLRMNI